MTGPVTAEAVREQMAAFGTAEQVRGNRIVLKTTPGRLRDAITAAQALLAFDRLITISTADNGEMFELFCHLIGPHRIILSLRVELPRDHPVISTLSDLLPPAGVYERQIHDLFGITFEGHPGLRKIILNEDWPENEYPLRKDWKPRPDGFYGGIRKEGA